jgi:hypothetical protein
MKIKVYLQTGPDIESAETPAGIIEGSRISLLSLSRNA